MESMVLPALQMGGYALSAQQVIGTRPGGKKHKIDIVAEKDGKRILISLKWQQVGGTAEQKVPFEVICLMDAVRRLGGYAKAYLVLGGEGWTLRRFFIGGGLQNYLSHAPEVEIIGLETFVARANSGTL